MRDKVIIGAGLYGLYAALHCARKGQRVTVLEMEEAPFARATYVNQARVHMGYHYPRSLATAMKSAGYFRRFVEDYSFCIHSDFQQVYATSRHFSWTDAGEFLKFCRDAEIPCEILSVDRFFKEGSCDGAFLTKEYTYDARILRDYFVEELGKCAGAELRLGRRVCRVVRRADRYEVCAVHEGREERYEAPFVLNAAYASVNQVLACIEDGAAEEGRAGSGGAGAQSQAGSRGAGAQGRAGNGGAAEQSGCGAEQGRVGGAEAAASALNTEPFGIKYELCEIILCRVNDALRGIGLTVMDGPFFSIMPFGRTGYHSLTSVTFTPHKTSLDRVPRFSCMQQGSACVGREENACGGEKGSACVGREEIARRGGKGSARGDGMGTACADGWLGNCSTCGQRPESAWEYMSALARKYVREEYAFAYEKSLFSMKPVLKASEIDDSRPTVIRYASRKPVFLSVLSGKINTVYDLDEFLDAD